MLTPIIKLLAAMFSRWRRTDSAAQELYAMSDRELAELGITRGQIPVILRGQSVKP